MTYTISAQERTGRLHRVPLKRAKATKDEAMKAAWTFSLDTLVCDVVVTRGSKHIATYRDGKITALNGKEYKS